MAPTPMIRRPDGWTAALYFVWALLVLPYVTIGPDDFEEYFTGVVTTKVAIDSILHGAWPLWNLDLGIGMPQPFRFHFITHPLSPLCTISDCHALLRAIAGLHLLIGAIFMAMVVMRFTAKRLLASTAALTFCLTSSVAQTMFTDDWPITAISESMLPVMLYAVLAIGDSERRRGPLLWSLVLGAACGLVLSMSFAVLTITIAGIVALSVPGLRQRFPWLLLSAGVTLLLGGSQLHHLLQEFMLTPATVLRTDHDDFPIAVHLWSAFLRPLSLAGGSETWRTVFFGPPFAVAAVLSVVMTADRTTRPLRVGLLLGILGLVIPPSWLLNINTAQWIFRTELNVFGILLGAYGVHRWGARRERQRWVPAVVILQLCWSAAAIAPAWYSVFATAVGLSAPGRHTLMSPGIAESIAALYARTPGRVVFAPKAHEALRDPLFNKAGLAVNQLQTFGVPAMSAVAFGIATDDLFPQFGAFEGEIKTESASIQSSEFLDVLGVRFVMALGDEPVAQDLHEIRRFADNLLLYENTDPWPEAFFVDSLPTEPVPRLSSCLHDRFLCADFSRYDFGRRAELLEVTRIHDGLRFDFATSESVRFIVATQWYRPGWTVTAGNGSVTRVAEQLVGIRVEPGQRTVTLRYRPGLRSALFGISLGTELVVGVGILVLAFGSVTDCKGKR